MHTEQWTSEFPRTIPGPGVHKGNKPGWYVVSAVNNAQDGTTKDVIGRRAENVPFPPISNFYGTC